MKKFWIRPICGIYKITHRESGKCYVGQSVDIFERWQKHSNLAVKKKSLIQTAFAAHGIENFSFVVLEECEREFLNDREVWWIACLDCVSPNGYNLTSGGGQGKTVSDETRQKQSEAALRRAPASEETRQKMSEAARKMSKETRQRISDGHQNRAPLSEETRRKISEARKAYWAAKKTSSSTDA